MKDYNDWCHRNQHYTSSVHSLTKFVLIHKHITLFRILSISRTRAASAALHTHQLGAKLSQGTQNSELKSPKQNYNPPNVNMKYKKSVKFLSIRILFCPVIIDGACSTCRCYLEQHRLISTGTTIRQIRRLPKALGQTGHQKQPRNIQLCGSKSDERPPTKSEWTWWKWMEHTFMQFFRFAV